MKQVVIKDNNPIELVEIDKLRGYEYVLAKQHTFFVMHHEPEGYIFRCVTTNQGMGGSFNSFFFECIKEAITKSKAEVFVFDTFKEMASFVVSYS